MPREIVGNNVVYSESSFWIDGNSFPAKSIHYGWESLASEDSGRTLDGIMHIYWVRPVIKKLEIVLPPVTSDTVAQLISLVQGKTYTIQYVNPATGSRDSFEAYTSNSKADVYSGVLYNGLYHNVAFNAIEV